MKRIKGRQRWLFQPTPAVICEERNLNQEQGGGKLRNRAATGGGFGNANQPKVRSQECLGSREGAIACERGWKPEATLWGRRKSLEPVITASGLTGAQLTPHEGVSTQAHVGAVASQRHGWLSRPGTTAPENRDSSNNHSQNLRK